MNLKQLTEHKEDAYQYINYFWAFDEYMNLADAHWFLPCHTDRKLLRKLYPNHQIIKVKKAYVPREDK